MAAEQPVQFRFQSTFGKIVTCKEGGIKLTLDVPQTEMLMAVGLMNHCQEIFDVIVTVVPGETIGGRAED